MASKNFYKIDTDDKLFVKCDGATTTFVDSASPAKTITANGNATQLPIKFNKSAGFFNGTSDYVVIPDSADWDFGTGDFDIEFFANQTAANGTYVAIGNPIEATEGIWIGQAAGNLYAYSNGAFSVSVARTPTLNVWTHYRVRRTGGNIKIYVDNSEVASGADSTNITGGTLGVMIGKRPDSTPLYLSGWLKELRIVKGASANAPAVPTTQYTTASEANTVLLMHFDTPATSPLGPAIAFDGTGDYFDLGDHEDFDLTNQNFCMEAFIKIPATNVALGIASKNAAGGNTGWSWFYNSDKTLIFAWNVANSGTYLSYSWASVLPNVGYHVAVCRNGTALNMFVNGVLVATKDVTGNSITTNTATMKVGYGTSFSGANVWAADLFFSGFIREFRLRNDAYYTTAFTPSQNGFTVDANTKLYIKGDENNGVTTFVDSETTPKTVTTAGDTKIKYTEDYRSCIFKDETGKFPYPVGSAKVDFFAIGSGVGYFDGTGDYLSIPTSTDFDFSNGALTMEFYARHSSVADTAQGYLMKLANGGTTGWTLIWNGAGVLAMYANKTDAIVSSGTYLPLINTWMHVAVSRTSDTWNLFVNGSIIATAPNSITISDDTNSLFVGHGATYSGANVWLYDASTYQMNGLLDNIRISKGVARYTTTFNPPEFKKGGNQIMWVI